ncbi:chromate transporter [Porphyromonas cangingivalis]|uniref:Chromate transporter n=2 Tax=Porphyromonas cangingivalis TaxID=36874 RepID=A0A1T4M759_PORCN|nr:chromate transporter [Porphyromonas cangingivalis]KGL49258.1 chromate transporter [Porphyromonas cangingivalis]SJZ62751.1 chromate transporter [Porphyromonas cangingivalis]VEJ02329.1 chromate transporter, chromate ion transporter (CHR) family [Porphyromonas cangingivalis]
MIYLELLWVYLKIGLFGFGGGYAMLSLIQEEVVHKHHWLTMQEFTDIVAISQMTPGPIGINSATYIGYTVTGSVWGSILATVAVSLPSFVLVLLISLSFAKFRQNKHVDAVFTGIRPAAVGLIAAAALLLINGENFIDYKSYFLFGVVLLFVLKKWLHPILLIILAGISGLILY